MLLLDEFEDVIDPEIEDFINFMDAEEQEVTGFLTKSASIKTFKK